MQLPMFLPESTWVRPTELPDLRRMGVVALDTETKDDGLAGGRGPGWVYRAGHVAGFSAAWREGGALRSFYMPLRHPDTDNFDVDAAARWMEDHLRSDVLFVFHNGPYDLGWIRAGMGVLPPTGIYDTTAAEVMIDENQLSYKLDACARRRGLAGKDETLLREAAAAYGFQGPKAIKSNLWRMPARLVGPYGEGDSEQTLQLRELQLAELEEQELGEAFQTEMDLIPLIQEMRLRGIRVDLDGAEEASQGLRSQRDGVLVELSDLLGRSVRLEDVRKQKNLEAWHDAARITYPRTPKTGVGSFSADWMRKHEHPLPRLISRATQLEEAASKFIDGFILGYAHRGRLHADINQFRSDDGGTRTHRFSYADPALQQMPGDKQPELKKLIRGLFLPEPGEVWGALDYSQQEYRLIVHFASRLDMPGAEEAVAKYRDDANTDFHQLVADMTGLPRRNAKDVNFAKVYGAGLGQFCDMTGLSMEKGAEVMETYDGLLPFPKALGELCTQRVNARGFIRLIDGARMHWDRWEPAWREKGTSWSALSLEQARKQWPGKRLKRAFAHKAMNGLIQGSAARQTKKAMVAAWREGIVPKIQLHDELSCSFGDRATAQRLADIMRDIVKLEVPMQVDQDFGSNWGNASKVEDKATKTVTYGATWEEAQKLLQ